MEKVEYRAVIRFLVLKSLKAKEIYEQLLEVYKESSTSKRNVAIWVGEFKRGRNWLEDASREGRPNPATTAWKNSFMESDFRRMKKLLQL